MVHKTSIAWKVALAFLLGAAVVFAAPVNGAPAWAADESPIAGMTEAKVAARLEQVTLLTAPARHGSRRSESPTSD